jgi:hypothetical protein
MRFPVTAMPGPILSRRMSNLAQKDAPQPVIVNLGGDAKCRCQIRIRKNFLNRASLASERNHPYLGRNE